MRLLQMVVVQAEQQLQQLLQAQFLILAHPQALAHQLFLMLVVALHLLLLVMLYVLVVVGVL